MPSDPEQEVPIATSGATSGNMRAAERDCFLPQSILGKDGHLEFPRQAESPDMPSQDGVLRPEPF